MWPEMVKEKQKVHEAVTEKDIRIFLLVFPKFGGLIV